MGRLRLAPLASAMAIAFMLGASAAAAPLAAQQSAVYADRAELAKSVRSTERASVNALLVAKGKSQTTADSLVETARFVDKNGVTHLRYEQRLGGLRVHGAYAKVALDRSGGLAHAIERVAPAGGFKAKPAIGEAEALRVAIDANFKGAAIPSSRGRNGAVTNFAKTAFFSRSPSVERVIIADAVLAEGFLVETWSAKDNKLYHTLVDGIGRVVFNELRTANDSYNVFTVDPDTTPQAVVDGPGVGNAQSPVGWLSAATQTTIDIVGNNVHAYLDRDNSDTADPGGVRVTDGNFLSAADLTQDPTIAQNQDVAVQTLFYLNNVIHDRLYTHGFTEGAGNFQEDNFGLGGFAFDRVDAEAQDGGGTNNANFATPPDGFEPRMQMYLWTSPDPDRDGDVDSDIVWHEYGHGLTWRMIGSMSGAVPGAIGEGMSDSLGIIVNNEDRIGEYSTLDPNGIRSIRYSQHLDTIGNFNSIRGLHRNGEIIAATIWDMWKGYEAASYTQDDALSDIVGGMNFIPAAPTYFHMRDGFLAQAPVERDCLIWAAFAARGMGFGGSMNSTGTSITQSFHLPVECGGSPPTGPRLVSVTAVGKNQNATRWKAIMTATVDDGAGVPVSGVVVSFSTDRGTSNSCTTGTTGKCSKTTLGLVKATSLSITYTVTALNGDTNASGVPQSATAFKP